MKAYITTFRIFLLAMMFSIFTVTTTLASDPAPPPPPGHGEGGNVPGGGAPVGSGLLVLGVLAAAYGGTRWFISRNKEIENESGEI
jgi:hypothetical protein